MRFNVLGASALLVGCATLSQAATLSFSADTTVGALSFGDVPLALTAFHPNLGTLHSVELMLTAALTIDAGVEHDGPLPATVSLTLGSDIAASLDGTPALTAQVSPRMTQTFALSAFDGEIDFSGGSGASLTGALILGLASTTATDTASLAALTGTQNVTFTLQGLSHVSASSDTLGLDPVLAHLGQTTITLGVTYTYHDHDHDVASVPLPASLPLLTLALCALARHRRPKPQ